LFTFYVSHFTGLLDFDTSQISSRSVFSYPNQKKKKINLAMGDTRPNIFLLHGAFHRSAAGDQVISHLSRKGYRCIAPQLCFVGVGGHGKATTNWHPSVEQVQQLLSTETSAGRDVVVVNHSLGGLAGCSWVKGYTDASN
jgi:alpha-beta hydrolase superfamily lysophospholipase